MLVGGWAFFHYANRREILDIEFASGTDVQFQLKAPMHIDDVRKRVSEIGDKELPSPSVVEVRNAGEPADMTYEVITPNPDRSKSAMPMLSKFAGLLNIEQPSTFRRIERDFAGCRDERRGLAGDRRYDAFRQCDSAGPGQLSRWGGDRAEESFAETFGQGDSRSHRPGAPADPGRRASRRNYRDFTVFTDADADVPVDTALVLTIDPEIPYDKDELKWKEEVAGPMWKMVGDAITQAGPPPEGQHLRSLHRCRYRRATR